MSSSVIISCPDCSIPAITLAVIAPALVPAMR